MISLLVKKYKKWNSIFEEFFEEELSYSKVKKSDYLKFSFYLNLWGEWAIKYFKFILLTISIFIFEMSLISRVIILIIIGTFCIKLIIMKSKQYKKANRLIQNLEGITFNDETKDRWFREKTGKYFAQLLLYLSIFCFLILSCFLPILVHEDSIFQNRQYTSISIELLLLFYISLRFFLFFYLRISKISGLIVALLLSNPIIATNIFLVLIDPINRLITGKRIFRDQFESGVYVFVEIGIAANFVFINVVYSLFFQILFALIQPVYKIEKSRFALEVITATSAITSLLVLLFSNHLSQLMLDYINYSASFKQEFYNYARVDINDNRKMIEWFNKFFERTFKLVLLPYTLCSSIALAIFKYREINAKSKGNKHFQSLLLADSYSMQQQITILRKALYFGGGSIKNSIISIPKYRKLILAKLTSPVAEEDFGIKRSLALLIRFYRIKCMRKWRLFKSYFSSNFSKYSHKINYAYSIYKHFSRKKKIRIILETITIPMFVLYFVIFRFFTSSFYISFNIAETYRIESYFIILSLIFVISIYDLFKLYGCYKKQVEENLKKEYKFEFCFSVGIVSFMLLCYLISLFVSVISGVSILLALLVGSLYILRFLISWIINNSMKC